MDPTELTASVLGTPLYAAPEISTGVYDKSCDIWFILIKLSFQLTRLQVFWPDVVPSIYAFNFTNNS